MRSFGPPPRKEKTEETLKITGFDAQGFGVAGTGADRPALPYCTPGDLVRAAVSVSGRYSVSEILHAGPGRTAPKCPLFFKPGAKRWCGGCDFQHLGYDAQLKAKSAVAAACLGNAGLRVGLESPLPSPLHWRYRNKMQLPFAKFGGQVRAGFFHPGTHELVDCPDCAVQSESAVKIALEVKAMAAHSGWSVYNEDEHTGWLRHILIRTNSRGEAMISFVGNGEPRFNLTAAAQKLAYRLPQIKSVYLNIQMEQTSVVLGRHWEKLLGETQLEEKICGRRFLFYPGSFLQVNTAAAQELYKTAAQFLAQGARAAELYDLYCGIGVIGLSVGAGFKRLTGIEENAGAAACAWKNARLNNIPNARFIAAKAEDFFSKGAAFSNSAAVIMDPPRTGCSPKLLTALNNTLVKKIVYISCNPETFARDAKLLTRSSFELKRVKPADLFPQTAQVELVAFFERRNR
ncbi:MAG: 23S rRNA (uracil(1939)-C(5))-methyltransferase RlmD [Elusimicrobiales bacterium]